MNEILELREGLETFLGRGLTLRGAQDVERGAKEIVVAEESKSLASFFPVLKSMRKCNPGGISWPSRTSVKPVVGANARG